MKKIIFILILLTTSQLFAQSVLITPGINSPNIEANSSTNGGITPPRMTNSQIQTIASPTTGTLVFDTDVNCLRMFDGTKWECQTQGDGPVMTVFNQYGTSDDQGNDIVVRGDYVYVVGEFSGTMTFLTFPNTTFISDGGKDGFVAKFTKNGFCLWAKHIRNTNEATAIALAVDANNNVYVSGNFTGNVIFGGNTLTGIAQSDVFLTKYDTNGNLLWYQLAAGLSIDLVTDMAVNSLNEVFITGSFRGTVDYSGVGAASATSAGETDIFLAKYNANTGGFLGFIRGGGTSFDSGLSLFISHTNKIYLTGQYQGVLSFASETISNLYKEGFILTLNNNLLPILLVNTTQDNKTAIIPPPQNIPKKSFPTGIYVQNDGTCLVSSSIFTYVDLFSSNTFYHNFPTVTKYNNSLVSQYTKLNTISAQLTPSQYDNFKNSAIKSDLQGNIYCVSSHFNANIAGYDSTGTVGSNEYFTNNQVIGNKYFGDCDFQLVKYQPNGIPIWVKTFGGISTDHVTAMDISPQGEIFITGYVTGNTTFGNINLTGNGGKDFFILKITE